MEPKSKLTPNETNFRNGMICVYIGEHYCGFKVYGMPYDQTLFISNTRIPDFIKNILEIDKLIHAVMITKHNFPFQGGNIPSFKFDVPNVAADNIN